MNKHYAAVNSDYNLKGQKKAKDASIWRGLGRGGLRKWSKMMTSLPPDDIYRKHDQLQRNNRNRNHKR